ncbi:hypothetical protein BDN72DRAFT_914122 [Pluteus cervinus]|uniref:Uncharacterized protein n=1 Tax=Pluteus cervinus TaxID=181527 RepID=A0ACD3B8W9_9AGAR|nr:hypothetical protein BDN72DRAFT_914122 [Pluteus cervinus]
MLVVPEYTPESDHSSVVHLPLSMPDFGDENLVQGANSNGFQYPPSGDDGGGGGDETIMSMQPWMSDEYIKGLWTQLHWFGILGLVQMMADFLFWTLAPVLQLGHFNNDNPVMVLFVPFEPTTTPEPNDICFSAENIRKFLLGIHWTLPAS